MTSRTYLLGSARGKFNYGKAAGKNHKELLDT
jgi:hypothetical protein